MTIYLKKVTTLVAHEMGNGVKNNKCQVDSTMVCGFF